MSEFLPARFLCLTVFAASVALAGCKQKVMEDTEPLRFSAIPDQPAVEVEQQHKALVERLCASIKKSCVWIPVDSYESLVDRVGRGEVDVAYFGGVTFAQALHRHQAVPLAMRDIDFRFTSVIVVPKESKARGLDDLRQVRFTFGNRSSTSGHFMLRRRLHDQNVMPEQYFSSVAFTSDHDATMRAVANGVADAGGVNASVFHRRLSVGDPVALALRVVWQSAPYIDYVWAARAELSAPLRQSLIDAFLDLDFASTVDGPALQAEGASGYLPAFASDFQEVTDVLRTQDRL